MSIVNHRSAPSEAHTQDALAVGEQPSHSPSGEWSQEGNQSPHKRRNNVSYILGEIRLLFIRKQKTKTANEPRPRVVCPVPDNRLDGVFLIRRKRKKQLILIIMRELHSQGVSKSLITSVIIIYSQAISCFE